MSREHSSKHSSSKAAGTGKAVPHEPKLVDAEPTANSGGISVVWICVLVVALYWGDMYVMSHGGDLMGKGGSFPQEVYYPVPSYAALEEMNPVDVSDPKKLGELLFAKYQCFSCHQYNGLGVPNLNPPLAGSEWVTAEGPNRIIRIVLDGLTGPIEVSGKTFNGTMVPWRDVIKDDAEIAAILSYIRNAWGNQASMVTPEEVAAIRKATESRASRAWTAAELQSIPPK